MIRRLLVVIGILPVTTLCGCRSLALLLPEQTRTVAAEYPYLAGRSVAVVVRAADELLFEYPHVQWEVADHVRVALEGNVRGIKVISPRRVVDFQRSEPAWQTMDPAILGRRFQAERLLEIELTQYTTREPDSPHLYRGHIQAAVRVYNTEYTDSQPAYHADVETSFPPDGPGRWGTDDRTIRAATMEAFASELAGKFYDRKVKVR
jgi:hypothetical protein